MGALSTKVLETNRLVLRHLNPSDLNELFALYCDSEVSKHLSNAPRSIVETQEELARLIEEYGRYGFGLWATVLKATNEFVGRCGLRTSTIDGRQEVEVVYALGSAFWGQGLATEAAQEIVRYGLTHLHFSRLICLIEEENQASIHVARKIGMTFERQVTIDDHAVHLYAI